MNKAWYAACGLVFLVCVVSGDSFTFTWWKTGRDCSGSVVDYNATGPESVCNVPDYGTDLRPWSWVPNAATPGAYNVTHWEDSSCVYVRSTRLLKPDTCAWDGTYADGSMTLRWNGPSGKYLVQVFNGNACQGVPAMNRLMVQDLCYAIADTSLKVESLWGNRVTIKAWPKDDAGSCQGSQFVSSTAPIGECMLLPGVGSVVVYNPHPPALTWSLRN